MSCCWDVWCVDCATRLGVNDANHRVVEMRMLVKHAKTIEMLGAIQGEMLEKTLSYAPLYVELNGITIEPIWFRVHAGHHLVPINEYGELDKGEESGRAEDDEPF